MCCNPKGVCAARLDINVNTVTCFQSNTGKNAQFCCRTNFLRRRPTTRMAHRGAIHHRLAALSVCPRLRSAHATHRNTQHLHHRQYPHLHPPPAGTRPNHHRHNTTNHMMPRRVSAIRNTHFIFLFFLDPSPIPLLLPKNRVNLMAWSVPKPDCHDLLKYRSLLRT